MKIYTIDRDYDGTFDVNWGTDNSRINCNFKTIEGWNPLADICLDLEKSGYILLDYSDGKHSQETKPNILIQCMKEKS